MESHQATRDSAVPLSRAEVLHDPRGTDRDRLLRDFRSGAAMGPRHRSRPRGGGGAGSRAAAAELGHALRPDAARPRRRARAQGARTPRRDRASRSVATAAGQQRDPARRAGGGAARCGAGRESGPGGDRNARALAARAPVAGLGRGAGDLDRARPGARGPSRGLRSPSPAAAGAGARPTSPRRRTDRRGWRSISSARAARAS